MNRSAAPNTAPFSAKPVLFIERRQKKDLLKRPAQYDLLPVFLNNKPLGLFPFVCRNASHCHAVLPSISAGKKRQVPRLIQQRLHGVWLKNLYSRHLINKSIPLHIRKFYLCTRG